MMVLTPALKNLILGSFDANAIKEAALNQGMITLQMDAAQKVSTGMTSIEEVLRVTHS